MGRVSTPWFANVFLRIIAFFVVFAGYALSAQAQPIIYGPNSNNVYCPSTTITYQLSAEYKGNYQNIKWTISPASQGQVLNSFIGSDGNAYAQVAWSGTVSNVTLTVDGQYKTSSGGNWQLFQSEDNYTILSLPSIPTNLTASHASSGTVCISPTQTYTYSVSSQLNVSYEWEIPTTNGTIVSGNGTRTIQVQWNQLTGTTSATGTVRVRTKRNDCPSAVSNYVSASYSFLPPPVLAAGTQITGPAQICAGKSYTFTLNGSFNWASAYHWVAPDGSTVTGGASSVVEGSDGKSATITFSANANSGSVRVIAENSCGTGTSLEFPLQVISPLSAGTISGPVSVCANVSYTYSIPAITGASYQWNLPAGVVVESGQNTSAVKVHFTDSAFPTNASGNPTPASITVTVNGECNTTPVQSAPIVVKPRELTAIESQIFSVSDLSAPSKVAKELLLNTCNQVDVNLCNGRTIQKAVLKATLSTGDIHLFDAASSAADFATTVTFKVTGYNEQEQVVFTQPNLSLTIGKDKPEQTLILDFTAQHTQQAISASQPVYLTHFTIEPLTYSGPATSSAFAQAIRLKVGYEEAFTYPAGAITVSNLTMSSNDPATLDYERTFNWQSNCPKVANYQFQLLRLFIDEKTGVAESPDTEWSKALSIETEKAATYMTLTIAEGSGKYLWRVRAIGNLPGGIANPLNWGEWSSAIEFTFTQPDEVNANGTNWIYSRTMTEGGRLSEKMSFANGLGQIAQSQTRIQSQNQVLVAQTKQDYVGRDALQTLPVPVKEKARLGYIKNMLLDAGNNAYIKEKFDGNDTWKTPAKARTGDGYYSGTDNGINQGVASAEEYPYTRTVFTTDGTNRVKEQGGVGATHTLGSGHTVRSYYSAVAEDEVVKLFGEEAPKAANLHKTITYDPNGTASVTYQSKDGKTIATALIGGDSKAPNLDALVDGTPFQEINETITEKSPFNGIGTTSRKPLVLTEDSTKVTFSYSITPETIGDLCQNYCTTCDYTVKIRVINQEDPTIVKMIGDSIVIAPGSCASLTARTLTNVSVTLPGPATYVIEKTVTAHNRASGASSTYLEAQLTQLETSYSEANLMGSGDWKQIMDWLSVGKAKEVYALLDQKIQANTPGYSRVPALGTPVTENSETPYYIVPVALPNTSCESLQIHLPVIACEEISCNLSTNSFEAYYQNHSLNAARTPLSALPEFVNAGFTEAGVFDQMIANMLNEREPQQQTLLYSCETVWNCWQTVVDQYLQKQQNPTGNPTSPIPGLSNNLDNQLTGNYQYNGLLDQFFLCSGAKKTEYYTQERTEEHVLHAYKFFYLDQTHRAYAKCWEAYGADASVDKKNNLYLCLKYSPATLTDEAATQVKNELLTAVTGKVNESCAANRETYRQQIIQTIHSVDKKLIEGLDQNELVENAGVTLTIDNSTYPLMVAAGAPLTGYTFSALNSYQVCQVEAMADAMVAYCQQGITPEMIQLAGQNTLAGKAAYQKIENILLHGFDIKIGGSCGSSFEIIDPSNIAGSGGTGTDVVATPVNLAVTQTGPAGVGNSSTNAFWLDASRLTGIANGAKFSSWTDVSGNNNHATQTNATYQPTFKISALNGKPAIKFNAAPYLTTLGQVDNASVSIFTVASLDGNPSAPSVPSDMRQFLVGTPTNESFADYTGIIPFGTGSYTNSFYVGKSFQSSTGYKAVTTDYYPLNTFLLLSGVHNESSLSGYAALNGKKGVVLTGSRTSGGSGYKYTIGRRGDGYSSTNSTIAEVILYKTNLNSSQRIIVENYLAAKYALTIEYDYYTNPVAAYHLDVQGIGTVDGTDKHSQAANGKGLILSELNGSLNAANEYVFAGHASATNAYVTNTGGAAPSIDKYWQRDWYIQKTNNVDAQLTFDFAAGGITIPGNLTTAVYTYNLLYRATPTDAFTIASTSPILNDNNRISFALSNDQLKTGYYTLGMNTSNGLLAYWKFDEGQGTVVSDASGNGNNGTIVGSGGWTTSGKVGAAFTNSTTTYVSVGDKRSLDLYPNKPFTITAWFKTAATRTDVVYMIVSKSTGYVSPQVGYHLAMFDGKIRFAMINNIDNDRIAAGTDNRFNDGKWHHVAWTYNGNGNLNGNVLYVDGVVQPFSSLNGTTINGSFTNTAPFLIGGRPASASSSSVGDQFDGQLDEIRVYNRALGSSEIGAMAGSSYKDALLIYWNFEESSGNIVKDASCNGYDATFTGGWTRSASGKIGQSIVSDGTSTNSLTTAINWQQPTAFSVGFWINPVTLNSTHSVGADWGYFLWHTGPGGFVVVGTDVATYMNLGNGTVVANQWQHFAFTFDNGTGKLYKNGVLLATKTGMTLPKSWYRFYLSQPGFNGTVPIPPNGQLDEVQLYKRALTDLEVGYIYNTTQAIVSGNCTACRPAPKICFKYKTTSIATDSIQLPEGMDPVYIIDIPKETCEQSRAASIAASVRSQLESFTQQKLTEYRNQYQRVCVAQEGLVENFSYTYTQGYHHFTLYYYDRAGRLIATVPPEGVDKSFLATGTRNGLPTHRLKTTYTYNSLSQLVSQNTPDGGTTNFYYNNKSQLRYSQNAKQVADGFFSYTKYDGLGRVVEVGESNQTKDPAVLTAQVENMSFPTSGLRQRTSTVYSLPASDVTYTPTGNSASGSPQRYLQNRVSYVTIDADGNDGTVADRHRTYYSYDPHGNVEWLVQELPTLGRKYVRYEYDLISGKVLRVNYQENTSEQFYHRYGYDEDNRLTQVETSADGVIWDKDATYSYYLHGPLKRMELGEDKIQGIDYTYTVHGWLKAINHPTLTATDDPGQDGGTGKVTPTDAFGMALTYYSGDYTHTGSKFEAGNTTLIAPAAGRSLYNGNISAWTRQIAPSGVANMAFEGQVTGENYTYDELNRITSSSFQAAGNPTSAFGTSYKYDPNGNLLDLTRKDKDGNTIDQLHYEYNWQDLANEQNLTNNRLRQVVDNAPTATKGLGAIDQADANNYDYDPIGNLIEDKQDNIKITWNVYGKVESVKKNDNTALITYQYDASGNRTVKVTETRDNTGKLTDAKTTYYVRDAQGNVLSVYEAVSTTSNTVSNPLQKEIFLYGSSRLGVFNLNAARSLNTTNAFTRMLGQKDYELTDHLGNVRAVVGDYRSGNTLQVALKSYANYYAFGLEMPGMNYNAYRYGYNGKEKDKDFANNYDYGFRIYNPAVGKFLSVDPLTASYPFYSPYQFAGNMPVLCRDIDGAEPEWLINTAEWVGHFAMEVKDDMVSTGKSIANLASTYGTGVYNAATVYIPQGFGYKGGEEANLHTTEGTVKWASGEAKTIVQNSAGKIGKDIVTSAATAGLGKAGAYVGKPVLKAVVKKVSQYAVVPVFGSGIPIVVNKVVSAWPWKKTTASIAELMENAGTCDKAAKKIQEAIGGDIIHIIDKYGAPEIGNVYTKTGKLITKERGWKFHYAVRKGEMIYDRITGPEGMNINEYKKLFTYGEYLLFDNVVK
ncbi:LamG-like jellyroll fold domain-containing protein [Xanthocytophaga agilis]|uniref:RHS repeat-associated core domain-containing protein n=1 Tax=Xanthocytophaga agilis TaxID=3048010 RepID=A0AAE3UDG0_9BACT|nr:LamG-like jellyroll fold domain-containing protein [Xanthocytophaga agilis]MDJ1501195.1 RHS repeat-associated core domain-containing protein [Xanthocytophaga agilis]